MEKENRDFINDQIDISAAGQGQSEISDKNTENGSGEKLFTAAEVSEIVRKRLSREKSKEEKPAQTITDTDLSARSNYLDCKEFVLNNGLSTEILDIIDTSDFAAFKEKAEKLANIKSTARPEYPSIRDAGEVQLPQNDVRTDIEEAFLKTPQHKPKKPDNKGVI